MSSTFSDLLSQAPQLLIALGIGACAILAFVKRAKLGPTASTLAGTGLAISAFGHLASFIQLVLIREIIGWGRPTLVFGIMSAIFMLIDVVSLGLIISSIFVKRPAPAPVPVPY